MVTLDPPKLSTDRQKRFTAEEYLAMTRAGIFDGGPRVELLDGKIYVMAGMGTPHFMASAACRNMLTKALGDDFFVLQQLPVRLGETSEPEPDIAVVRGDLATLRARGRKPIAEEIVLLIEISDTTYAHDSTTKLSSYALAGIPEYWIVNLERNCIEQRTVPERVIVKGKERGVYRSTVVHFAKDTINALELGSYAAVTVLGEAAIQE